jgi:hypothetical protein
MGEAPENEEERQDIQAIGETGVPCGPKVDCDARSVGLLLRSILGSGLGRE